MKINLTKLREMANKTGEGEDHVQKIRNAQEFVYSISPMLIVDLIDEIERLHGALEFYAERTNWKRGDCNSEWSNALIHHDCALWNTGGGRARLALAAHRERFEE